MKTLVLVGEEHTSTTRDEIASGAAPRIESLELARTLEADVLDYRDVAQATDPSVVAARVRSPAWGLAVMAALLRDRYEAVYLTGEDIGIPLAFCLRASRCRRRITAVVHNAGVLSRRVPFRLLGQAAWDNLICLSFNELRDAYDGARFVVVPIESVDYAAGVSTICEAMAMGKAIIATASPGIIEYLEDQVTGLVVPSGDAESMATAIDSLWHSPERCEEMGRHNRRLAETVYSLDRYVSTVVQLMSE